jgi:hypothetical protein
MPPTHRAHEGALHAFGAARLALLEAPHARFLPVHARRPPVPPTRRRSPLRTIGRRRTDGTRRSVAAGRCEARVRKRRKPARRCRECVQGRGWHGPTAQTSGRRSRTVARNSDGRHVHVHPHGQRRRREGLYTPLRLHKLRVLWMPSPGRELHKHLALAPTRRSLDRSMSSPSVEPLRDARAAAAVQAGPRLTQRHSAAHRSCCSNRGVPSTKRTRTASRRCTSHSRMARYSLTPLRAPPAPPSRLSRPAPGWDRRDRVSMCCWCVRAHPPAPPPKQALRRMAAAHELRLPSAPHHLAAASLTRSGHSKHSTAWGDGGLRWPEESGLLPGTPAHPTRRTLALGPARRWSEACMVMTRHRWGAWSAGGGGGRASERSTRGGEPGGPHGPHTAAHRRTGRICPTRHASGGQRCARAIAVRRPCARRAPPTL